MTEFTDSTVDEVVLGLITFRALRAITLSAVCLSMAEKAIPTHQVITLTVVTQQTISITDVIILPWVTVGAVSISVDVFIQNRFAFFTLACGGIVEFPGSCIAGSFINLYFC